MNFSISSSTLSGRLQAIGRVITSKNTIALLDCFFFEIQGKELTITASDGENTLKTTLTLEEESENIRFAVNAKTLQDAMKEIPEQPLRFLVDPTSYEIEVNYQNGQYKLIGQDAFEYPTTVPDLENVTTTSIPSNLLASSITRALFATADDEMRPVMNGVLFDMQKDGLTIVASDGHKLVCDKSLLTKNEEATSFIMPKKPASLLKQLLNKSDENVTLHFNKRNAEVNLPDYNMTCRLIDGVFPNYNSVIPKDNPNCATINRLAFLGALRRVLIFSNQASALIKLQLRSNELHISSQDVDFSRSAEESLVCEYGGMPLSIGFKGTSLIDILNNINNDDIILKLGDPSRAGIIVPAEQPQDENILMLLMPMMLND